MKKKLMVVITVLMALCALFAFAACEKKTPIEDPPVDQGGENGEEVNIGTEGLEYSLSEDKSYYICTGIGTATETNIVIASVYQGLPVTSIEEYAFGYCSSLTSIVIPDSVTSIGRSAFYNCSSLTSIVIPDNVTSIGRSAFYNCSSLTSIVIPDSVTSIEDYAFSSCSSLTNINVTSGNTTYHSNGNCLIETESKTLVFGCQTSVIPTDGSVTSIGYGAFVGCSGLKSIVIPDSVTSIGDCAFEYCTSLTSVTIGNGVTSIGYGAFAYCNGLTNIKVTSGNTTYHSDGNCLIKTESKTLVLGCQTSVIPSDGSVTSIGYEAFAGCSGLKSIVIPDNVTSIGSCAFWYCSGLTSIVIPDGVTSIGNKVFFNCSSLTSVTIGNGVTSIEENAFGYCSSLTSIVIPDSVTTIGSWTFANCSGLESVTIGNGVTLIELNAFYNCSSLTDVYYAGTAEEWKSISIRSGNTYLTEATIHYQSDEE